MKKKDLSDLRDAQLRAEPDYKDLCRLLDRQTYAQKDRLAHELAQSQGCEPSQNKGADTMEDSTKELDARIVELKAEGLSFSQVADRLNAEGFTNQAGGKFTRKSVAGRYYRFKGKEVSQDSQGCDSASMVEHPANDAQRCDDSTGSDDRANVATGCEPESHEKHVANVANSWETAAGQELQDKSCDSCEPCEDTTEHLKAPLSSEPSQACESSQYSLPPEMIEAVRALIREELQAMKEDVANLAKAAKADVEMPPSTPKAEGSKRFLGKRVNLPGTRVDQGLYELFRLEHKRLNISASNLMQRILWLHFGKPRLSFESAAPAQEEDTGKDTTESR